MKIKLEINPKYKETEVHICSSQDTPEVHSLYRTIKRAVDTKLVVYEEEERIMLSCSDIIRIFAQNKNVYVATAKGVYRLRERLYELEEQLDTTQFVRISNSEIVNLKKIERMDTSITGTIRMYLKEDIETYVSRRYVTKIKQVLGI